MNLLQVKEVHNTLQSFLSELEIKQKLMTNK